VGWCGFHIELGCGYFGIICLATVLATFSKNWAIFKNIQATSVHSSTFK
jgi:hypothetical protein